MYLKTRDHSQAAAGRVNERLESGEFIGQCACCSGELGMEGTSSLGATGAGKEDVPTPGQFYRIQHGKGGLETTARRAYNTRSNSQQVERAQEINNHPYNRRYWRSPNNQHERRHYRDGIISFNPNFICEEGRNKGQKRCFARICIPQRNDISQPKLKAGNESWKLVWNPNHPNHPNHPKYLELQQAQKPFATILGCSDSRVPPEIVFSQNVGDIFTVRTAGQVLDKAVLGTLEYAAKELCSTGLFVVLGHENCGAVKAAVAVHTKKMSLPSGDLGELINDIIKVVRRVPASPPSGMTFLDACIKENAKDKAKSLRDKIASWWGPSSVRQPRVVPAYYSLKSGEVEFL
jgi:carbonic anhydrase